MRNLLIGGVLLEPSGVIGFDCEYSGQFSNDSSMHQQQLPVKIAVSMLSSDIGTEASSAGCKSDRINA